MATFAASGSNQPTRPSEGISGAYFGVTARVPPAFTWTPKTYWVYFKNGKVVQWGEPGDFTGKQVLAVLDYSEGKGAQ